MTPTHLGIPVPVSVRRTDLLRSERVKRLLPSLETDTVPKTSGGREGTMSENKKDP